MHQTVPTVYIIDDDDAVRSSIRVLLGSVGFPGAAFASAQEFLATYAFSHPGCVLLDVRMPGMSGLELQEELNRRGAVIPVIFLTGNGDVSMAVESMRHGAFDFLQKPFRDSELIACVKKALALDGKTRAALKQHDGVRACMASLSPREQEILDLLLKGCANKVMAMDLRLSQRTVEIHRARVMDKMGARSLAQLVRMVHDVRGSVAAQTRR